MIKWTIGIVLVVLFLLSTPALFRKRTVALVSNNKVVAVAKRPSVIPSNASKVDVFAGKTNLFSLWADTFDYPLFIYPFAENKRFLCVYDDDTAVLVFVVDFGGPTVDDSNAPVWPPYSELRQYLANRATNVVILTRGSTRLPTLAEVEEASSSITNLSGRQFRVTSFPNADFGLYRFYWPKDRLVAALHPDRGSYWP